jgi:hypothetical protein
MPVFICAGFQDSSADFSDCPINPFDCEDGQGEERMVPGDALCATRQAIHQQVEKSQDLLRFALICG